MQFVSFSASLGITIKDQLPFLLWLVQPHHNKEILNLTWDLGSFEIHGDTQGFLSTEWPLVLPRHAGTSR